MNRTLHLYWQDCRFGKNFFFCIPNCVPRHVVLILGIVVTVVIVADGGIDKKRWTAVRNCVIGVSVRLEFDLNKYRYQGQWTNDAFSAFCDGGGGDGGGSGERCDGWRGGRRDGQTLL